jgi:hypothetical protein
MASPTLFLNLARVAKVAALLLFLLPFVTVSCSTREAASLMGNQAGGTVEAPPPGVAESCVLIQASGLQLAMGTAEPSRSCLGPIADMAPENGQQRNNADSPFGKSDYAVIGAAAVLLLTLLLGFALKGVAGIALGILGALAAIGAVAWSVFVRIPEEVFAGPSSGSGTQLTAEQAQRLFTVAPGIGFWLMAGALLLAILFYVLALRKPAAAAASAEGTPPPAG